MQFKSGDVVTLKSGGPDMTVTDTSMGQIACVWFDGKKQVYGSFPAEALELSNE